MNLSYIYKAILAYFLLFIGVSFAQNQETYSLLWKIEGNGLTQPSYLFGTMHVEDELAFNFSDEVLPAIENSDYFALEIHPDSLISYYNSIGYKIPVKEEFKKILKPKEYKQLSKRFFKIHNSSIEDCKETDPDIFLKNLFVLDEAENEKSVFVDLHLYAQAKTMNKKILGLESHNDIQNFYDLSLEKQRKEILEHLKYNSKKYNKTIENLKEIYISGDLNKIDVYITKHNNYDKRLKTRNIIMVKSITAILNKNKSLFSAVGAAHLPGEFGLIQLLRKKGYTVNKVDANFTGVADSYKVNSNIQNWNKFTDKDFGYQIDTPGTVIKSEADNDVKVNYTVDLATGNYYMFFAIDGRANYNESKKDTIFNNLLNNSLKENDNYDIKKNKFQFKSFDARSLEFKTKINGKTDTYTKTNYYNNNGVFYVVSAVQNVLNKKVTDRFFKSFDINKVFTKRNSLIKSNYKSWITYNDSIGAFSVKLPNSPKKINKKVKTLDSNGDELIYDLKLFLSTDNSGNYLIRYNDFPIGYRLSNLSEYLTELEASFGTSAKVLSGPKKTNLNGYKAYEYSLLIQNKYYSKAIIFFNGNRMYLLMYQYEKNNFDSKNPFLNSFRVNKSIDNKLVNLNEKAFSFKLFKNQLRSNLKKDFDHYLEDSNIISTLDTTNGNAYFLSYSKLKPYFKIKDLNTYYDIIKDDFLETNDSIIKSEINTHNDVKRLELYITNTKDQNSEKHYVWLKNSYYYSISAHTNKETLNSKLTNALMNSFRANNTEIESDYFSNKSEEIFKGLKSSDSTQFNNALGSFIYYEYDTEELKTLHEMLNYPYKNHTNKNKIVSKLLEEFKLLNDSTTVNHLTKLYKYDTITEKNKRDILITLLDLNHSSKYISYTNLLFNKPPEPEYLNGSNLLKPFYDSIPFAIKHQNKLIQLSKNSNYTSEILKIFTTIIKNKKNISENVLLKITNNLIKNLNQDKTAYLNSIVNENIDYNKQYIIANMLGYFYELPIGFKKNIIDEYTQELLASKALHWIKIEAIHTRLKHELDTDKKVIKNLIENSTLPMDFIIKLYKTNQLNHVPKSLLKKEAIAFYSITNYITYDDEYPNSVELIDEFEKDGKKYRSYKAVYKNEEVLDNYLFVCELGDDLSQESDFKDYQVYTSWEIVKGDWKEQSIRLISR